MSTYTGQYSSLVAEYDFYRKRIVPDMRQDQYFSCVRPYNAIIQQQPQTAWQKDWKEGANNSARSKGNKI